MIYSKKQKIQVDNLVNFPICRQFFIRQKIIKFAFLKKKIHSENEMVKAAKELESGISAILHIFTIFCTFVNRKQKPEYPRLL